MGRHGVPGKMKKDVRKKMNGADGPVKKRKFTGGARAHRTFRGGGGKLTKVDMSGATVGIKANAGLECRPSYVNVWL